MHRLKVKRTAVIIILIVIAAVFVWATGTLAFSPNRRTAYEYTSVNGDVGTAEYCHWQSSGLAYCSTGYGDYVMVTEFHYKGT